MTSPELSQNEDTRQRIIDAFWKLRESLPLSQLKVRSIADAAGCSRTTFYKYFDSVYDLQEQAQHEVVNDIHDYLIDNLNNLDVNDEVAMHENAVKTYEECAYKVSLLFGSFFDTSFTSDISGALQPVLIKWLNFEEDTPASNFKAKALSVIMMTVLALWEQEGKPISADELADWIVDFAETIIRHYNPSKYPPTTPENE